MALHKLNYSTLFFNFCLSCFFDFAKVIMSQSISGCFLYVYILENHSSLMERVSDTDSSFWRA